MFLFLIYFLTILFVYLSLLVYLWAEVLDADVYAAFKETGNVFDPDMAELVRKYIYSSGNTEAPDELFRKFRGRDPDIKYMLEKKSLVSQN
jgi:peptidyl-dipeptidase Dcp